jgi:hypothetical protein
MLILGALAELWKVTYSFVTPVRISVSQHEATLLQNEQIFMKFDIWVFFFFLENISKEFKLHQTLTRVTGILREDQYTFLYL